MPNGDNRTGNQLLNLEGRPIIGGEKPRLVILKVEDNKPVPIPLLQAISKFMKANVLVLPYEYELMSGAMAVKEIKVIHQAIHNMLAAMKE